MSSQKNIAGSLIWHFTRFFSTILLLTFALTVCAQESTWKAPASADDLKNPVTYEKAVKKDATSLYSEHCLICHGKKGDGKGVAAMNDPDPADLRSKYVQDQTDGAIFWKVSEGHERMVAYKGVLTEQQRWALVSYIREL